MKPTKPTGTHDAVVQIDGEHETQTGWLYTFSVQWADGSSSDHEMTISWVDHEHLVGGGVSPSVLAHRAATQAANHLGKGGLPARCDVSSLSRMIENFDALVREM